MGDLSDRQKQEIAQRLEARAAELLQEIRDALVRSGEQHYVDLAGRVTDTADQSVADMLVDMDTALVDREMRELRQIEAAKLRIKQSDFGGCLDCGGDIGYERLLAYPTATRCVVCQRQHEKTYAGEGNPSL